VTITKTQITRGAAAATVLLQIPQKRAHAGWREIIDRKAINWLPQCLAQERKQKDQRIAVTELGIAREIALFGDVFQEEPAYPWSNRTIHSLAKFIGMHSPEHVAWCAAIRGVPFKKTSSSTLTYLDKPEMDALLHTPDLHTALGMRDHALLLFLYNTGARADEAAHLSVDDITWGTSPAVRLVGKGKMRWCPIWPRTANVLKPLVAGRACGEFVFLNRLSQPLTRFGIYAVVRRTVAQARQTLPSLVAKTISPHCLRHTCAVHLLRSGVDINTIRAWLGHVSLDTTHIYAEVDLEMKAKALALCDQPKETRTRPWHTDAGLMSFLKAL
jgi:integrase/recombinase XerD